MSEIRPEDVPKIRNVTMAQQLIPSKMLRGQSDGHECPSYSLRCRYCLPFTMALLSGEAVSGERYRINCRILHEPSMTSPVSSPVIRPAQRFATTRWSLIVQARHSDDIPARAALGELCEAYWLPVYGFMRRQTKDVHEAQDLTQGFFASLLARDALADLYPDRGRFRSFLLATAKHFVCNEWDKKTAVIRGGKVVLHSLDYEFGERELSQELSREQSAEAVFERRWAVAILDRVLNHLRAEFEIAGKTALFEGLSPFLSSDQIGQGYPGVCESLNLSPEAARVAAHRMRKRYRQILREEIAHTTATPHEVDDEIRHLFAALRRS